MGYEGGGDSSAENASLDAIEADEEENRQSLNNIETALTATSMQARAAELTASSNSYATVKIPSANATHLKYSLAGTNDAIISLDNEATEHFVIRGGEFGVLENLNITSGVAIKAKNKTAGANFTNLNISIW